MRNIPKMERRHFEFIAEIIKSLPVENRKEVYNAFVGRLSCTNGNFKKETFREACGVMEE